MCYRGPVVDGRIICPACGEENPLDRTHCLDCGELLVPECVLETLKKAHPDIPPEDLRLWR